MTQATRQDDPNTELERELTYGEKAVGINFNPGANPAVEDIKRDFANIIDKLHNARESSNNSEVKRMLSKSITEAQDSQMWAVKAITWKY